MTCNNTTNLIIIFIFTSIIMIPSQALSKDKDTVELNIYKNECTDINPGITDRSLIDGASSLIGEGINYLFSHIKKELKKTEATYSASYFYPQKNNSDANINNNNNTQETITNITDIKCIETIRKQGKNINFKLQSDIIYTNDKKYLRIKPTLLDFRKSAAKYGKEKDLNIVYTFTVPTGENGSMEKISFSPIYIKDIKEPKNINIENKIDNNKFISTDWVLVKNIQNSNNDNSLLPFSLTSTIIESSTEKGKAIASILIKTIENEEFKKKVAETIINGIFPKENTEKDAN